MTKKIYWGWYVIMVGTIAYMFTYGLRGSFGVFFPSMIQELRWSRALLSGAASVGLVLNAVLSVLFGFVMDRYGAKYLIVSGVCCIGFSFIFISQFTQVWHFYLLYGFLFALGVNFMGRVVSLTMAVNWFVRKRAIAIAIVGAGAGLGSFIFNPLSNLLINLVGWRYSFMIIGIAVILILVPLSLIFVKQRPEDMGLLPDGDDPATKPVTGKVTTNIAEVEVTVADGVHHKNFWLLLIANTIFAIPGYLMATHLVILAVDRGISAGTAAFCVGLAGLSGVIMRFVYGYFADKINNRKLPVIVGLCFAASAFVFIFFVNTGPLLIIFALFVGLAAGGTAMFSAFVGDNFGRISMGRFMGFLSTGSAIGASIGPVGAGLIFDIYGSYDYVFYIAIACYLIGALCIFLTGKTIFQIKTEEAHQQQSGSA